MDEPLSNQNDIIEAMNSIMMALSRITNNTDRRRIIDSVVTLLGLERDVGAPKSIEAASTESRPSRKGMDFSQDLSLSPKQFLLEKNPQTDVERIACLAYYLTHYRNTPHFKTVDLSQLNTEAAQQKFSNATFTAKNAIAGGFLAPAAKGNRQLSAAGEQFVRRLPDRDAAKAEMARVRRPKRTKKSGQL